MDQFHNQTEADLAPGLTKLNNKIGQRQTAKQTYIAPHQAYRLIRRISQDDLIKEIQAASINHTNRANAWLPNDCRCFTVKPQDITDLRLTRPNTQAALVHTLSDHVLKTQSQNHAYPQTNMLPQTDFTRIKPGLRILQPIAHKHVNSNRKLLWKKRKLIFYATGKLQPQTSITGNKSVNGQVNKAITGCNTKHKPAPYPP